MLCYIFHVTFKYMIYLTFLAFHAKDFHGYDTKKNKRGKHAIVGLQQRKIPVSQKEMIWLYCYGSSGGKSFFLAKI